MEVEGAIKYEPGLVKYKDLHTTSLMNFSEFHIKSSGGENWDEVIKEINEKIALQHFDPPAKEKKIFDYYFQHHIKPRKIASKLKISSHKVYSDVKSIKNVIKRFENNKWMKASQSRSFSRVVLEVLSDSVDHMQDLPIPYQMSRSIWHRPFLMKLFLLSLIFADTWRDNWG